MAKALKTPKYKDACEHEQSEYVGTWRTWERIQPPTSDGRKFGPRYYDIYIFADPTMGVEVCCRTSSRPEGYSSSPLWVFMRQHKELPDDIMWAITKHIGKNLA